MAEAKKAVEYNAVTMTDGRVVEFPGKRKMIKESFKGEGGDLYVRLDFVNGETRLIKLHPDLIEKYALHGAEQKYGDETAGVEDVADMVVAIDALDSRLSQGVWTKEREGGGGFAGASIVLRAIAEVKGVSIEKVKAFVEAKLAGDNAPTRQALYNSFRQVPAIKAVIDRLEAEKAAKGGKVADAEAALAELG